MDVQDQGVCTLLSSSLEWNLAICIAMPSGFSALYRLKFHMLHSNFAQDFLVGHINHSFVLVDPLALLS